MRWLEEHGATLVVVAIVLFVAYKLYSIQTGMNAISAGGQLPGVSGTPAPLETPGDDF